MCGGEGVITSRLIHASTDHAEAVGTDHMEQRRLIIHWCAVKTVYVEMLEVQRGRKGDGEKGEGGRGPEDCTSYNSIGFVWVYDI